MVYLREWKSKSEAERTGCLQDDDKAAASNAELAAAAKADEALLSSIKANSHSRQTHTTHNKGLIMQV